MVAVLASASQVSWQVSWGLAGLEWPWPTQLLSALDGLAPSIPLARLVLMVEEGVQEGEWKCAGPFDVWAQNQHTSLLCTIGQNRS